MAYGSPENAHDIDRYLQDIFGNAIIPPGVRAENFKKYSLFGNRSPSNEILARLQQKLSQSLSSLNVDVFLAFKHWFPKLEDLAHKVREEHYSVVIGFPLFPFRSEGVFNSYLEPFMQAFGDTSEGQRVELINGFSTAEGFSDLWTSRLEQMHVDSEKESLLFVAHSLPTTRSPEESYREDFLSLADEIAKKFPDNKTLFGFQSVGKHGGSWLGPPIEKQVLESNLSGTIVLVPVGFVNDHLEVLYDLDLEFSLFLREQGISYRRVPLLNDSPDFVSLLHNILADRLNSH